MKILAIGFDNLYSKPLKYKKDVNTAVMNNFNLSSQAAIAGRSQINFTGLNSLRLWEQDKKFLDVTAANLRLNQQETKTLYDAVRKFMIEHKLKYLDDMVTGDLLQEDSLERELIRAIREQLGLSEYEEHITVLELFRRLHFDDPNSYNPTVNKYVKDGEQCKNILTNYNVPPEVQVEIFSMMGQKAEEKGYDTIFDLFTQPAPDKDLLDFIKARIGKKSFADACLDFYDVGILANKGTATLNRLENIINKYIEIVDEGIAKAVAEEFKLDMLDENLLELVKLRKKEGVSDMEVAFKIADRYELPQKAEAKIKKILQEYKQYEDEYVAEKTKNRI